MKIVHLQHGDAELWQRLGPYLVSREVHKALGGPIYSTEGTHWWIALERGKVLGFASMRPTKSAVWYDYAYVVDDEREKGVFSALAEARDAAAVELHGDLPTRVNTRADRWSHYKRRGWTVTSERGEWIYGIREPKT